MLSAFKTRFGAWLFQWRGPQAGSIVLVQRRVFILPTRYGLIYALSLALMLTGSINYGLSLGFVLTFLLTGLGINAIVYTFRNLAQLKILPGRTVAVFAGDSAQFALIIENSSELDRYAIDVVHKEGSTAHVDVAALASVNVNISAPAPNRGLLRAGRLRLLTMFPLGLCRAWAYADLDMHCVVYPRPEPAGATLPPPESYEQGGVSRGHGNEDFTGLRAYYPGDPPRHIAWKAAARDQTLRLKQFGGGSGELWLDWNHLPSDLEVEARLSRLARWILDAHAAGLSFGLRLPARELPPAMGDAQRENCLKALALFGIKDGNAVG